MFITTLLAVAIMAPARIEDKPLKCAVMGSNTKATSPALEYGGARFPMCCGGCPGAFAKEPGKYLAEAAKSGDSIGMFMFCPVSGEKLDLEKVKNTVDYKGIRYGFCCEDCVKVFNADKDKYTKMPKQESMVCAMSGEKIESISAAAGFMDHNGVRYYTCCGDCLEAMKKDIQKVLVLGRAKVTDAVATKAPVKK